jgi:hypothetical protein
LVVGLAVAAAGTWLWVAANYAADIDLGWLAVPIGLAIGAAVAVGSGRSTSRWAPVGGALVAVLAMFLSQNFLQREQLYDGIDALQAQWDDLQVASLDEEVLEAADEGPDPDADPAELLAMRPEGEMVIPPPAIVRALPAGAFAAMEAEVLAIVWEDVSPEILEQVRAQDPDKVARAEEIRASGELDAATPGDAGGGAERAATGPTLEEAQARYEASEDEFDIPAPVAECATPPDFTQPTAQAGMGFADGVPLILPLADLLNGTPERGDGQVYEAPSPFCFGLENAKDQPVQTASWAVAIGAAAFVPWRLGRRDDGDGPDPADDAPDLVEV